MVCEHHAKWKLANYNLSYIYKLSFGTHLSVVCICQQDTWLPTMREPPPCLTTVPLLSDKETNLMNEEMKYATELISLQISITAKLLSAYFNLEQYTKSNFHSICPATMYTETTSSFVWE